MNKATPEQVEKFLEVLEYSDLNARSYSGRGMYGESCVSVSGDSITEVIGMLVQGNADMEEDGILWGDLADIIKHTWEDTLGLGVIIYWRHMPWPEGEEE